MKQRQQHVNRPMPHEKGPMYFSVVQRPPGAAPQPGSGVPPGCAPGGHWTTDKYCGVFSWILGVLCCWCVVCCPCDSRQVYNAPDGKKVLASGTPSGQFVEMC